MSVILRTIKEVFEDNYHIIEPYLEDYCKNKYTENLEVQPNDLKQFMMDAILCKVGLHKYTSNLTSTIVVNSFEYDDVSSINKETIRDVWSEVMVYQGIDTEDPYSKFVNCFLDQLEQRLDKDVFNCIECGLTNSFY